MTSTEIANASKIMIGSTEADKVYIGSTLLYCPWLLYSNGYACVDLGLPSGTRWATVNVGATSEISNGDYYQYGKGASKYADTRGDADYAGTETPLNMSVDTVRQVWGGDWHMPTYEQCLELINNCTWTWGRKNGKYGYIVSNNDKYIFLPVAGMYYNNSLECTNEGYYWIAKSEGSDGGRCIRLTNDRYYTNSLLRKGGFSVRGVLDVSAHALPAGYTELEYISSSANGNQYIDLGIKLYETLNTDYDIAMKFNIASGNANQATLFACQDSDNDPWPGTFVRVNSSSGKAIGRYIGGTAKDNTLGDLEADIELPVQTSPNKNVTSLNNNNTTHQYGTSLFCAFVGGTNTPARYCNAKLYYFKLFVGGALVRDLIPCKNSNNVVGMYDVVNNVFYTSPNGNAFVAEPPVNLDYVTNGLIFHLDGINKGTGADWVDLIGGIQFTKNGTDSASTSNSWNFPGNRGDYLIYTGSLDSIGGSDDFTVEVCYNNSSNSSKMYVFGCGHDANTKYPLYYHDGTYITWIQGGYTYNASSMAGNSKYTVSLNNNNGLVNGQLILKTSSIDYWDASNRDFRIGSAATGSATSNSMNGDVYSIRIYNRRLSQNEQLQNQRVDNIRFNLGLSLPSPQATPTYSLLDILYSDSSGNLSVDSQVLPTSEGKTPIALCIAGTNFFGDNEPARWMSLKYMSCSTPDSGTLTASSGYMMWGNNGLDISTIDDITTTYNGGSNDGYLTASWSNKTSNKIPSLYDSNNEWNLSELGTKNTYAVTDVDGKNKTEKILTITTSQATWQTDTTITNSQGQRYSPAACCCWRYSTLGTQQGDWYLPACGEMSMIVVNKTDINTKLAAINTEYSNDCINRLENVHFLTSTEINSGTIFRVLADDGRVGSRGKYDNSTVIALMQY